ncbi:DUF4251 domain-containing protein [Roseivirga sp.]|uniref:DUF4251 domain-containing protein n=1 Tax=Roseivirga sp. TaxID=1964215 RepID=UPI003B8D44BC
MRKTLLTLLGFILVLNFSIAQEATYFEEKEKSKKEIRKEKKKEKDRIRSEKQAVGIALIESRDFVLMASTISGVSGATLPVRETMNFVRIKKGRVTVQYGLPGKSGGANGLGGVTFEGRIQNFRISDKGDKKGYNAILNFTSPQNANIMSVSIFIWGDKAQARFFNGDRNVTFDGKYAKASETKLWESGLKTVSRF